VAPVLPEFATPGVKEERAAAVRFYGVTKAGNSVLVHVHGFMPYFYVRAWPGFKPDEAEAFRERLNGRLRASSKEQARDAIKALSPATDTSLWAAQPHPTHTPLPGHRPAPGGL
jgi:DNA polymerase delta subunit 1